MNGVGDYPDPLPLTIVNSFGGRLFGHLRLQKLTFLCEVESKIEKISDLYNFGCYKYGPYSEPLNREMVDLQIFGYIDIEGKNREGDEESPTIYSLTDQGREKVTRIAEQRKEIVDSIKSVLSEYMYWQTEKIKDYVYEQYVNLVKNPLPLKQESQAALKLADEYETKTFEGGSNENIIYSTIFTMIGEIYSKLSEKAETNIVESYEDTKMSHFQHWSRYLYMTKSNHKILSSCNLYSINLSDIQNSLVSVMIEAEKHGFAPTDEELRSKLPKETLEKLQDILAV